MGENTIRLDLVGENTKTADMVCDNTKPAGAASGELFPVEPVEDGARVRSPLLPVRHQRDFFVCDIFDAAVKSDNASMEHPIFSLSKKPDLKVRRYENGDTWAEIRPSIKGLATVFDRDILIYCISQLIAALNDGRPISQKLQLRAYDMLVATNRDTSGRGYLQLREALERLQGTQIATNIVTGGKETFDVFSLINRARIVRETREGRMQEMEIELSDWVFQAVEAQEVLTLDRRYFQLAKPMERRLYELARKHCGQQASFRIGLEKLRNKCGSQSTLKEFRRLLQTIIEDDGAHDYLPGYSFSLDADMVEVRPKAAAEPPALPAPHLSIREDTYTQAREAAPGWDVYGLEGEWRDWVAKKDIRPINPDAHFLAFCKRRGRYPGFKQ
ncbi:MAG: plasmid replication initiator TrfA [Betaproteobacteria bacterium]